MAHNNHWPNLILPLSYELHTLSTGPSAIVYDANGSAINTHLTEEQARSIVLACNLFPEASQAMHDSCEKLAAIVKSPIPASISQELQSVLNTLTAVCNKEATMRVMWKAEDDIRGLFSVRDPT